MAKFINDSVKDKALDDIATGTLHTVCAGQPTDLATLATNTLASVALTGGDFVKAAGDTSGRKVTIAQQSNVSVATTGTADHVAISNATTLLLVTTATSQALTSGGTVTTPAFKHEQADPV